jgi:GT2 family glycosyltransferase
MYKGIDVRIIVLDDCSSEENLEKNKVICASFGLDLLMHTERLGVAKSWNDLTRHVESEIVIILNDDVEVANNWIDVATYTLNNNPQIGVVGFNAYEGDNSRLQPNNVPTYVESDILIGGNLHPVLSARGFAFAFRRCDFDLIGGFNESYFCFFEEIDFNLSMMTIANKRNCILSYPIMKHIHGATTVKELKSPSEIFKSSETTFEIKWNIKWKNLRDLFNNKNIPKLTEQLNCWNSNIEIWQ